MWNTVFINSIEIHKTYLQRIKKNSVEKEKKKLYLQLNKAQLAKYDYAFNEYAI